jgi:hypothetical protein
MTRRFTGLTLAVIALVAVLAACNAATSSGSPAASAVAPTQAAPSAASEAPSDGASALPSLDLGSFAIPSFGGAADLEALLPGEMCGEPTTKFSMSGADFASFGADEEFNKTLEGLGKTAADVSFAVAGPTSGNTDCSAGIFRVNGANTAQLQQVFLQSAEDEGSTVAPSSVGGKSVFVITDPGTTAKQYVYFQGDAVIFAGAEDEATAGDIIGQLP